MSERKTAVTEVTEYKTTSCAICDEGVVVGNSAPDETYEDHGYAVLIGEGEVTIDTELNGNWSNNITFEIDEDNSHVPDVEGHVICDTCAGEFHGFDENMENFYGEIPDKINPDSSTRSNEKVYIYIALALLLILIAIIAIL